MSETWGTYDEWLKFMGEEIKKGYLCAKCGNVIDKEGVETEYAEDEICTCEK